MAGKKLAKKTASPRKGTGKWWRVLFAVSVALNLLLVGLIAGTAYRIKGWADHGGGRQGFAAGSAYIQALDHDSKHTLFNVMRNFRYDRRDSAPLELYGDVLALLRQDTVDEDALYNAMNRHADLSLTRLDNALRAMVAHLASLDVERRRAYADRLEHEILHKQRRRHKDRK